MALRAGRTMGILAVLAMVSMSQVKAADGITAKAAFDKMKTLAGEWKSESSAHAGDKPGKISYKVTGSGSVLMETDYEGTEHEMISMYHLDGDDLVMTHYCALGNQPKMKLDRAKSTADNLVFAFDGGTNFDPATDLHIHSASFKFGTDPKKFESTWEAFHGAKKDHTATFKHTRP